MKITNEILALPSYHVTSWHPFLQMPTLNLPAFHERLRRYLTALFLFPRLHGIALESTNDVTASEPVRGSFQWICGDTSPRYHKGNFNGTMGIAQACSVIRPRPQEKGPFPLLLSSHCKQRPFAYAHLHHVYSTTHLILTVSYSFRSSPSCLFWKRFNAHCFLFLSMKKFAPMTSRFSFLAQSLTPCRFLPVPQCWRSFGAVRFVLSPSRSINTHRWYPVFGGGPGGICGKMCQAYFRLVN